MTRTPRHFGSSIRSALAPVLTGLAYFGAAFGSLYLTRSGDGIAALWPASGIMLAVLLMAARSRLQWHIGAAAVASMAANLAAGNAPILALLFTTANISEAVLAAWLLRSRATCRISFTEPDGLICFTKAATMATALSATIATVTGPSWTTHFWLSWFVTDLLGILIVAPLILIVARSVRHDGWRRSVSTASQTVSMFGFVTLVTALCFWQSSYPLLFLPMLAVLLAVVRLGPLGAAGGVLIVAAGSSIATAFGHGPLTLVNGTTLERSLLLQFYLLTVFAASLPIATLLIARDRLHSRLAGKMRLLELAEAAAQVGHWRLDTATQTVTWSREVFRIHGLEGDTPPPLDKAVEAYHPDDRAMVAACVKHSLEHRVGFEFKARIVRPGGDVRHVFSKGEIDQLGDDGSFGLFGIIQDVTAQVAHDAMMEEARLRAEEAARRAIVMAETDQLTGIANRRRTELALDQAIAMAEQSCRQMSVAIFDIDHFKRVNDTYGHQAGDEVLKRVAQEAAGELRSGDILGRFGGEEFVIVLPDAPAEVASRVANRVRTAIEAGNTNPAVTISVGVAELAHGESADALLRRADQALYAAKRAGRNRLRLAA